MISYSRLLPLLIIVAVLSFSVRLSEVVTGISNISASAYAKTEETTGSHDPEPDSKKHESTDNINNKDEEHKNSEQSQSEQVNGVDVKAPKWRDASDSNLDVESIKLEMFEDLSVRRVELEKSEDALRMREALLKAAEKEVDEKVTELKYLREEIKDLLEEQGGKEAERIDSLVKIYEGMKPKDAARIFDTLDIDVLVRVLSKMSARKVSPILAAMEAERARTVTIMLAQEKTLPVIE